jgi:putative transcription antitermination factor YqgF
MRYLGIDYGKSKMGLAYSEGELAEAWKVVDLSNLEDAIKKTLQIIKEEEVENVVIGKPESGEARKIVENFVKNLKLKSEVTIIEAEETLTTQNAIAMMVNEGVSKKGRQKDDAYAAAIILQQYLDSLSRST